MCTWQRGGGCSHLEQVLARLLTRQARTRVVALDVLSQAGICTRLVEVVKPPEAPLDESGMVREQLVKRVQAVLVAIVVDVQRAVLGVGSQLAAHFWLAALQVDEELPGRGAHLLDWLVRPTRAAVLLAGVVVRDSSLAREPAAAAVRVDTLRDDGEELLHLWLCLLLSHSRTRGGTSRR